MLCIAIGCLSRNKDTSKTCGVIYLILSVMAINPVALVLSIILVCTTNNRGIAISMVCLSSLASLLFMFYTLSNGSFYNFITS